MELEYGGEVRGGMEERIRKVDSQEEAKKGNRGKKLRRNKGGSKKLGSEGGAERWVESQGGEWKGKVKEKLVHPHVPKLSECEFSNF